MNPKYAKFFEPIRINKMLLKNRIVMSPMGSGTEDNNGTFGARTMEYLEARAKGGAAMIITESQYVTTKYDEWMSHMTITDTEMQTKCWTELAERVHAHGSKLCIQMSCGLGKNAYILFGDGGDMVSASEIEAVQLKGKMCRPLRVDEIHEIVAAYRRGAERCVRAGVDAIEIHAHQGYLLDDFMTECWNKRTDEYGGSFENRMRFVTEIYNAIREVTGPNYPILIRMASAHHFEGGRTVEDTIEIAKYLEKLGIDAFNFSYGSYEDMRWVAPNALMGTSCTAEASAEIKKHLSVPVINAGAHTIDSAAELLNAGKMDIASFGRQMIADPDFPNKIFRGRELDVRPCLACNACCRRVATNNPIACAINTPAAAESRYPMKKTDSPKKVVVIGGGVAGMEAARVAALQGHDVTLYEKSDRLGGLAIPAGAPSFKYRLRDFYEWQKRQINQLGVNVVLNHAIDENSPELEDAHKIIVSLGANPWAPGIEGIDGPNVVDVTTAHENPELVKGDTIVVAGGGYSGCEAAIEFAMHGKRAICARGEKALRETEAQLKAIGGDVLAIQADIGSVDDCEKVFKETIKAFGKVDILVNNAGVSSMQTIDNISDAEFERVMSTNLKGTFNFCREAIKYMEPHNSGAIVNVSSTTSLRPLGGIAYVASKHAVNGMTRSIGLQYAGTGIRCNCVCPGPTNTEMNADSMDGDLANEKFTEMIFRRIKWCYLCM